MKNISRNIIQTIKTVIVVLFVMVGVTYMYAWTGPTVAPPLGNVPAPINVGGGTAGNIYSQFKTGLLTLDHLITGDLTVTSATAITTGQVLTADGTTGKVKWATPGTYHYFAPVEMASIGTGMTNNVWTSIVYPIGIPLSAKAVIYKIYTQANGWQVYVRLKDENFPEQIVAYAYGPNNSDDAASDTVVITIPYSADRSFMAEWVGEGTAYRPTDESGGQRASINIIGYIE